ncbi:L,D-transpeptidase family protein [Zobellella maritima]|uniref:L,D-transpeptidase family protein n=1 Tax=Zobellella maritima TaxID=2059725 RepID=UPI000E308C52|nr:L,D-transpeptidase family protein [Zobellella maritima]
MLRLIIILLGLLCLPVRAGGALLWHDNGELNRAGQTLTQLLLPEASEFAVLSIEEKDRWLTREWRQVLSRRQQFFQLPLAAEWSLAGFDRARANGELAGYMARQVPAYPGYQKLKQHYLALDKARSYTRLPPGPEVRPGERDRAIPALRQRLVELGYRLPKPRGRADALDRNLSEVLIKVQQAHDLQDNGWLNDETRAILGRTPAMARGEIRQNLRRWLLLPPEPAARYLLVNIPAYRLTLYNGRQPDLSMKVIVGRPDWPTPELATKINALKVNPDWTPTDNIVREDLLPAQRRDRGFLTRNGFSAVVPQGEGWVKVNPAHADLGQQGVRLVQAPGPGNALGRLKFEMPNRFDVYLHDTPDKSLFGQTGRALSHGCIRLAEPERLAESLGWRVPEYKQTRILPANGDLPVYLVYFTTWVNGEDRLVFSPDIYRKNAGV